ncbi:MAG: DUF309 domain-containing protein [Streptosporangiales bacterium]|nr:DUF309 domain-containing protein [Streptosporangiales bacterium]
MSTSGERDRDPAGRARSARPRDAMGRPLPYGAAGEPRVPEDATFTPDEGLAEAQRLIDTDRPFHAHEVLEAVWKSAGEAERELWRGMAQLAVGLTHVRRGNARGAAALLRRAADRIAPYGPDGPYGIDIAGLTALARSTAERMEREGTEAAAESALKPRLTRPE